MLLLPALLQDLVGAAIDEADSTRELLQRVTSSAGDDAGHGGGTAGVGALWHCLLPLLLSPARRWLF